MTKSQKKRKRIQETIIFILLLLISGGLVAGMVIQHKRQSQPQTPREIPLLGKEETQPAPQNAENPGGELQEAPAELPADVNLPNTSETTSETVPTQSNDENTALVEQTMEKMSLEEKIYQLFIVTPESLVDNAVDTVIKTGGTSKNALKEKPVGGMIYFSKNLQDADQTKSMISDAQNCMKDNNHVGLWVAVDEEGGTVARVADTLGTTAYEDMAVYGKKGDTDEVLAMGKDISEDISQFGFNLDFAPVADVYLDPANELQDRIFSSDPEVVSDMVSAMVTGLQDSGAVSATLKHFPGLGAEDGNSHDDKIIEIDRTYEELEKTEFLPFQSGIQAGADFVMVGHQILSCAEEEVPSDLSKTVITDWLRGDLGYTGIVVTDAQNMNTIAETYDPGEAALLSIQAGADIILMPADLNEAFQAIYDAVENEELSESRIDESVRRILTAKAKHHLL